MDEHKNTALFLLERKIIAHIDTKDQNFYNGLIKEVQDIFLTIDDRKLGSISIALSEIKIIGRFRGKI